MKKTLLLVLSLLFGFACLAATPLQPSKQAKALDIQVQSKAPIVFRNAPPFTFSKTPTHLMNSYYDYMIGSYNGFPLRLIPASAGGGYFMTYHGRRTPTGIRRVFYAHLDANGNLMNNNEITAVYNNEGYPTLAVDPVSGKPMYAWHANADADAELEVQFVSDAFMFGFSGLFNDIQVIANNPQTVIAPNGQSSNNNEFIWPTAEIGPSPIAGKRRVYVIMRNSASHTYAACENPLLAYADFDGGMLEAGVSLVWHYTSIPEMNQWNHDSTWRRPFHSLTVDNTGNVYYAGYHIAYEANGSTIIPEEDVDIFRCTNYGAGTWSRVSGYSDLPSWNPPSAPGSNNPYFGNPGQYETGQAWRLSNSSHSNAVTDNLGRVIFPGIWAYSHESGEYWHALQVIKAMIWDPADNSFKVSEIFPRKPAEDDFNTAWTPWDTEAPFGQADYDANGVLQFSGLYYPFPHWNQSLHSDAMFFHYNNIKVSKANEQGMMVAVWQDSYRAKKYNADHDDNYQAYANTPEIWISVSENNGDDWSDPIILNNVDTPQFAGIKPMWVYPADKVIYVGENNGHKVGKIGVMFYNDFTWGSNSISPPAHTNNDGGEVMFMELQIVFPERMGSLSGYITNNGMPLEGATISVADTQYSATSAADGSYHLSSVPAGEYTIYATKQDYNVVSHTVSILAGQNSVQNFELTGISPTAPMLQIPENDATMIPLNVSLKWSQGTAATRHKIYFGSFYPPEFVADLGNVSSYSPGLLSPECTYFWQVVPYNTYDEASDCPIWSFTTVPEGVIAIGQSTTSQMQPFSVEYGYERSASIYTAEQIGFIGELNKIGWYCATPATAPVPYKIYAGASSAVSFAFQSWDDLIAPLRLVKHGTYTFDTEGWHILDLERTVQLTGTNMIFAVETNFGGTGASSSPDFRYSIANSNSHIYWESDNAPPVDDGVLNAQVANVLLYVSNAEAPASASYFPVIQSKMGESIPSLNLNDYFISNYPMRYSYFDAEPFACEISPAGILSLSAPQDWHGVANIRIRASINEAVYREQNLKVIVFETDLSGEDFNSGDRIPPGWTQSHNGTTTNPWHAVYVSADNYAMYTNASTGQTVNEHLTSVVYDLSYLKEIEVSFDSDFLPYANASGVFAYSFNNVTFTPVANPDMAESERKSFQIPNLDGMPNVCFRWTYFCTEVNDGTPNHWTIDNFSIYGTVKDNLPPLPVNNLSITEYHSDYVQLGWEPSSDLYFDRYELYISTDEVVNTRDMLWSVEQDPNMSFPDCSSTRVSALEPGRYWLAIRAVDTSANASDFSNVVSLYSNDQQGPLFTNPVPALQPLPDWQETLTPIIGCRIYDDNCLDPNSFMYRIDLNANGIYDEDEEWQTVQIIRSSGNRERELMHEYQLLIPVQLSQDGCFAFEIKAQDLFGNVSYSGMEQTEGISDDWILRIDTMPPDMMEFFYVQEVGGEYVRLSWNASYDANFKGYRILYGSSPNELNLVWDWEQDASLANAGTGVISTSINGLQAGRRYWFQLLALDNSGRNTIYPDIISAITASAALPKAPENLILQVEGDRILLSWDAVTQDLLDNPIQVSFYHIYCSEDPDFDCDFYTYLDSTADTQLEIYDIVEYVDKLFFKVIATSGAIRKPEVIRKKPVQGVK